MRTHGLPGDLELMPPRRGSGHLRYCFLTVLETFNLGLRTDGHAPWGSAVRPGHVLPGSRGSTSKAPAIGVAPDSLNFKTPAAVSICLLSTKNFLRLHQMVDVCINQLQYAFALALSATSWSEVGSVGRYAVMRLHVSPYADGKVNTGGLRE
jgi:hypothetical protein